MTLYSDNPVFAQIVRQDRFEPAVEKRILHELNLERIPYPNLEGHHLQYRRFVILSAPRTCSTYVSSLLQSHPDIVSYNELFQSDRCHFNYPFFAREDDPQLLNERNRLGSTFLEQYVFRGYAEPFSAVGFKMLYPHFEDPRFSAVRRALLEDGDLYFIHLLRKNYLHVLVSAKRAMLSNEWWRIDPLYMEALSRAGVVGQPPDGFQHRPKAVTPFVIHPEEAAAFFEDTRTEINRIKDCLKNKTVFELNCEDITAPAQGAVKDLLEFLGVSVRPLKSRNIKQNVQSMRDNLLNYEVLKKHFADSVWSAFFDE